MANSNIQSVGARQTEKLSLTGKERFLGENDLIVSKTDLTGKIIYANKIFMDISDYTEGEVLGSPHSMIRHPEMPRAIFKLLWQTLESGEEIFAYVVNRCKNGDHYWVYAHVTPSFDVNGKIIGYHSSRRAPKRDSVNAIVKIYDELRAIEQAGGRKEGLLSSSLALEKRLQDINSTYEKFVTTL